MAMTRTTSRSKGPASELSRQEAAKQCVAVFDTAFFRALCEPARVAVLQEVVLLGRADVATIAQRRPQDRSVIARHLQQLATAGIVVAEKEGRHVFYRVDANAIARRLESILAITHMLEAAMAPDGAAVPSATAQR
jgi:DNA-binding transcriptional ArsR family regulator